jgi:hypothetical protein
MGTLEDTGLSQTPPPHPRNKVESCIFYRNVLNWTNIWKRGEAIM